TTPACRASGATSSRPPGAKSGCHSQTTPEQTILDLAHRPQLGDAEVDVPTAVAALYERSDESRLQTLATDQRRGASLTRARAWAHP
ncbi:type IV toxin-antitoxin system AbiEi family antitoxin, partial [Mycobacterium asiaticum]|uniref:type IV toxin-antitoxin system AbiEi family antitoxin n=1 Tax=Mycobacterium asiaticum TaxID=1790 RepID=UPI003F5C1731